MSEVWLCTEVTCSSIAGNPVCRQLVDLLIKEVSNLNEETVLSILKDLNLKPASEPVIKRSERGVTVKIPFEGYECTLHFEKVSELQPLEEFLKEFPPLKPVYDVLSDFLPTNIQVIRQDVPTRETVRAFAIRDPPVLFFRDIPPSPTTFAHELIHLASFEREFDEEVYAHNLSGTVVFMAEKGMKANPFRLYDLTEEQVNSVLRELGIESVEEFYTLVGCIPHTHKITPEGLERNAEWREVLAMFITEITAGIGYDPLCEQVLEKLLLLTTTE